MRGKKYIHKLSELKFEEMCSRLCRELIFSSEKEGGVSQYSKSFHWSLHTLSGACLNAQSQRAGFLRYQRFKILLSSCLPASLEWHKQGKLDKHVNSFFIFYELWALPLSWILIKWKVPDKIVRSCGLGVGCGGVCVEGWLLPLYESKLGVDMPMCTC